MDATPPVDLLRVARGLLRAQARVIGLVPAGEPADVAALASGVARALATLTGEPIGVIDGWPRWSAPGPQAGPQVRAREGAVSWLTLAPDRDAVTASERMAAAVAWASARFGRLLVDVTALPLAHAPTLARCDAVVPVAVAGRTREPSCWRSRARCRRSARSARC